MHCGQKIKALREDHDLTQEQIAKILGTTKQQISKYEKDQQDMTTERLREICKFFKVSADYILGLPKGLSWPR